MTLHVDDAIVAAIRSDAEEAYADCERMPTTELLLCYGEMLRKQLIAHTPAAIVFAAGRLALIAAVLKARGVES